MYRQAKRNLEPTAPARIAMTLWCHRYAAQNGGSMDFWDTLRDVEKDQCRRIAEEVRAAKMEE
jgi:hypothetical protein